MSLIEFANALGGGRASALTHACREWRVERGVPPVASGHNWTRELVSPELMGRWFDRSHDEVSFRFTQLLMAHVRFDCYSHWINRVSSPVWPHWGAPVSGLEEKDSAYHKFVRHTAFEGDRIVFVRRIETCDPHDLVRRMLKSPAEFLVGSRGLCWDHCRVQGGGWLRPRQ